MVKGGSGTWRALGVGAIAALATALILGVPTDVVPNPWFGREIGVRTFDVVVLVVLSVLSGALVASYVIRPEISTSPGGAGLGAGALGWFAIGCPVCNKLIVAMVGASGASGAFASIQPVLGLAAVGLAAAALVLRFRALRRGTCPVPSAGGARSG